jgi:hypothetical protein
MRGVVAAVVLPVVLAGCATPSIPQDYSGPRAVIADSTRMRGWIGVDYFVLQAIDGRPIRDSMDASVSYGNRPIKSSAALTREVPGRAASFTIAGITRYATAIEELRHPAYRIAGTVSFAPEPDGQYVVRGMLEEQGQAVWIEDARTGAVMGRRIETPPATAAGSTAK